MIRKPFNQLDKNFQITLATLPMSVPLSENPDNETFQQLIETRDKFLKLSKVVKERLSSSQASQKIQAIGQKYGFELLRLANITRLVREYYFGEVAFKNFPAEIERRMGVSLLTAQEITRYLKQEIIDWDPWGEYLARLPHLPLRQILAEYPKIGNMEITAGYIELKGSEDLEDPTIKNWLHDFVLHLGQERHSQMQRTQYLFHSENGKGLSSQDREKLGIILRSFDENTPLPVDEENNEIVFESVTSESASSADRQKSPSNSPFFKGGETTSVPFFASDKKSFPLSQRGIKGDFEKAESKQDPFIKPYAPISRPTLPPRQTSSPQLLPSRPQSQPTSPPPSPYKGEGDRPVPQFQPATNTPANFASQTSKEEINKYFSTPESLEIPEIKIHSITEHNEPKIVQQVAPRPSIQRPVQTSPQPFPLHTGGQAYKGEGVARPKHRMIEPFFSKPEPRIDGNIVDLSEKE